MAQTCEICQEVLADPKALLEHKRNVHANNVCFICAKVILALLFQNVQKQTDFWLPAACGGATLEANITVVVVLVLLCLLPQTSFHMII